jgi:hypothetical protein
MTSDPIAAKWRRKVTLPRVSGVTTACLGAYVVLAIALFWPSPPWDSLTLPAGPYGAGSGDPTQTVWFLNWVPFALRHTLNVFETNYLNYPFGADLGNNSLMSVLGLLGLPVTMTLGPVAAFNVLLRLAFASSAGSMFLVLRNWARWPAAFVGGLFYGFGPYMIVQGEPHLNLAFVALPPVIVWLLYDLLVVQRRSPLRTGVALGALCAVQALIEPELLVMLATVVVFGLAIFGIVHRGFARSQIDHVLQSLPAMFFVFLVLVSPLLWAVLVGPGHLTGPVQSIASLQSLHADLLAPLIPTSHQFFTTAPLNALSANLVGGNSTENVSYLGLPAVVLLVLVAVTLRRNLIVVTSASLAAVAFVLSLGSSLTVAGQPTGITMPETFLTRLPLIDNIVPVRFGFVVALFATIALAVGGDLVAQRWMRDRTIPTRRLAAGLLIPAVALALVFPRAPIPTQPPAWPSDVATALSVIPQGATVLAYPYPYFPDTDAMRWQVIDGMRFRLLGGDIITQPAGGSPLFWTPLLTPASIQEFFVAAMYGPGQIYPAPDPTANLGQDLCSLIANYNVGAVVFWNSGGQAAEVKSLLLGGLGQPRRSTSDGSFDVWITSSHTCFS